jgi:hypothetical protein
MRFFTMVFHRYFLALYGGHCVSKSWSGFVRFTDCQHRARRVRDDSVKLVSTSRLPSFLQVYACNDQVSRQSTSDKDNCIGYDLPILQEELGLSWQFRFAGDQAPHFGQVRILKPQEVTF